MKKVDIFIIFLSVYCNFTAHVVAEELQKQLNGNLTWLKPCEHQDPNQNNCFRDLLQSIIGKIIKGIPEVDIKPFEPLALNEIKVHRENGQIITLQGSFDNVKVFGLSNATLPQAYLNLQKKLLNFKMEIPKLRLGSTYSLKGNILLLPLVGNGNVNILLKNVKTTIYSRFNMKQLPEVIFIAIYPSNDPSTSNLGRTSRAAIRQKFAVRFINAALDVLPWLGRLGYSCG